ncbi:hypothetical protein HDE76_003792, partial [Rhodanobacter sp. ANJX3]|nr:hypothetical protein [Rhodanobacter sp. ANJX3]
LDRNMLREGTQIRERVQLIDIKQNTLQGHKKSGLQQVKAGFLGRLGYDAMLK